MHRILAFSTDDEFRRGLAERWRGRDECALTVVEDRQALFAHTESGDFDVLVVDESLAEWPKERREALIDEAGARAAVLLSGRDIEPGDGWSRLEKIDELDDWLDEQLLGDEGGEGDFEHRPESAQYFVGDTQGRACVAPEDDDDISIPIGLGHHTSEVERSQRTPARLLYIGPRDGFRRELEAKSKEFGVAAAFAGSAAEVALSDAADALDLAVFAVDGDLTTIRRAIRFLRRQQLGITFDIALLCDAESSFRPGLARSLGADTLLRHPLEPSELLERVTPITGEADCPNMLVISSNATRRRLVESALSREPVDLLFTPNPEQAARSFESWKPDIALIDNTAVDGNERALVHHFRERSPFALTRYVKVVGEDEVVSRQMREAFDDLLYEPLERADIRRVVRRQSAQLAYGRMRYERDRLTGVHSALVLSGKLQATLDQAREEERAVILSAVDIDDLSALNERFGTIVGDAMLRSLADSLRIAVESAEAIFRTRDDEFFVLQKAEDIDWMDCRDRLERALRVFQTQTFRAPDGRGAFATATAGTIVIPPVPVDAEFCLQKSWLVLERAMRSRRESLLVAHLDPEALPQVASARDRADERE